MLCSIKIAPQRSGLALESATCLLWFNFWAFCSFKCTISWLIQPLTCCLACMLLLDCVQRNIRLLSHQGASCPETGGQKLPRWHSISGHARVVCEFCWQYLKNQNKLDRKQERRGGDVGVFSPLVQARSPHYTHTHTHRRVFLLICILLQYYHVRTDVTGEF